MTDSKSTASISDRGVLFLDESRNVSIDYMCFTLPVSINNNIPDLCKQILGIDLKHFRLVNKYRYHYKQFYTIDGIGNIYTDGIGDNKGTIHFEITGTGCGTVNCLQMIDFVIKNYGHFTRVDLAIDDDNNILKFSKLKECRYYSSDRIVSKFKSIPLYMVKESESIIFGEKSSKVRITIYNKGKLEKLDFQWVRVELRIRDRDWLQRAMIELLENNNLGEIAKGLLKNYLCFKTKGVGSKYKRETEHFWNRFLGDVEKRKLRAGVSKTVSIESKDTTLEKILCNQIKVCGIDKVVNKLCELVDALSSCKQPICNK